MLPLSLGPLTPPLGLLLPMESDLTPLLSVMSYLGDLEGQREQLIVGVACRRVGGNNAVQQYQKEGRGAAAARSAERDGGSSRSASLSV